MRKFKTLICMTALLLMGSGVASAIPILQSWGLAVDGLFLTTGGWDYTNGTSSTQALSSAISGLGATPSLNLDQYGLGDIKIGMTGGAPHTVAMWFNFWFWDKPLDPFASETWDMGEALQVSTADTAYQYPSVTFTASDFGAWMTSKPDPRSGLDNNVSAAGTNPVIAVSQTLSSAAPVVWFTFFSPKWLPSQAIINNHTSGGTMLYDLYGLSANDPGIIWQPPSSREFYIAETSTKMGLTQVGDNMVEQPIDWGTLYIVPEPDAWVLAATGLLMIAISRLSFRRRNN